VTFKDGAATLGTGTLNGSGQATLSTAALSTGSHSITAVYGGDGTYGSSTSATLTQTVNQATTSTAVTASVNPATSGTPVTLTATVTSSGTPTGTVTFKDGAATLGTGTLNGSGQATFTTSTLAVGSHSITAVYGGDTNYTGSTSAVLTQTITPASSSTTVTASTNPATFGASVTFSANVSGSGATPTGTVAFKDSGTTIGTVTLNGGGQATFSTAALATGSHSITAVYSGDGTYGSSTSATLTQTVNQAPTSTGVTASANPATSGTPVTLTATVTSGGTATGTVTFKDGAATLGTGTVNGGGQATFTTSAFTTASHSITAVYGGDTNYTGSTSPVLTLAVNQNSSTTAVTSSANPGNVGAPVTFTATLTVSGVTATGMVTFKDGATTLGTGTLNGSGQATFTTSTLAVGSHSITAVYGGDANYIGSTSAVLTQAINQVSSSTAITASANPATSGTPVTFTASVSGSANTPTGTLTFKDGATTLGAGTLNGSGQATFTTSALTAGSHSITAAYSGDSNYTASVSPPLTLAVNQNSSTTAIASSVNPGSAGTALTFTATVTASGVTATGVVTFKDGATTLGTGALNGSGQAAFTTSTLAVGTHSITAVYGGDVNYTGSTSPVLTEAINADASATALASSANPATFDIPMTLTAMVSGTGSTPTGIVTFKDGTTTLGTASLNGSGQAVYTLSTLSTGSHAITAVYAGDGTHAGSISAVLTEIIGKNSSTTSLTSSSNPVAAGAQVTLTATVVAAGSPTGTVTFRDGANSLGTVTLDGSGHASLIAGPLGSGTHPITAAYSGDGNFTASLSPVMSLATVQGTTVTTLASSLNPSTGGQTVTFTAAVKVANGNPTGTIAFRDGSAVIGSTALAGNIAALSTSSLVSGTHSITATYSGDANFATSTSAVLIQSVNVPVDSLKLRALQIAGTRINAENSGAAVSGAMEAAIAEGLADDCGQIAANDGGIRFNSGCGRPADERKGGLAASAGDQRLKWLSWVDFRDTNVIASSSNGGTGSSQINALAGLTLRIAPDLVTGVLGGYEKFDYIQENLNGQLRGAGWTAGAFLGWRLTQGLRFDVGAAFSEIGFDATAGNASAKFPADRVLLTTGLTGSYKFSSPFELEPSARVYAQWEREYAYADSLGTPQADRSFSNGRASTGVKLLYKAKWSDVAVTPFVGVYADYYFTRDNAGSALPPTPSLDGASARIVSGVSLTSKQGAQVTIAGEFGGLGSALDIWSVRARIAVPF
jgi:Bacterial Ig-like domain (group 3)